MLASTRQGPHEVAADKHLNTLPIERPMKLLWILLLISLVAAGFVACSKDSNDAPASGSNPDLARGRAVFVANCVACHNNDPSKDGPIGPAIKGSSRELLESRVLSTSYPPNYKPKRPTQVMPQFPYLKDDIQYLAAYLK